MEPAIYFPARARYFKSIIVMLACCALFSVLLIFIPFSEAPVPVIFFGVMNVLLAYFAILAIGTSCSRKPTLIVDDDGLQLRTTPFSIIVIPWKNVNSASIKMTSSRMPHGREFIQRFIDIELTEYERVKNQLPLVTRIFAPLIMRMGMSPVTIPEIFVNAPLESVLARMKEHERF